jgi:hypothetical protein
MSIGSNNLAAYTIPRAARIAFDSWDKLAAHAAGTGRPLPGVVRLSREVFAQLDTVVKNQSNNTYGAADTLYRGARFSMVGAE